VLEFAPTLFSALRLHSFRQARNSAFQADDADALAQSYK